MTCQSGLVLAQDFDGHVNLNTSNQRKGCGKNKEEAAHCFLLTSLGSVSIGKQKNHLRASPNP
jgi:hypothetical protein